MLLETALDTLLGLLAQSVFSDKLMEHIQSIVPRLLPLTTSEQSMQIRMSALRCLDELCNLPTELLLPFKDEVWFLSYFFIVYFQLHLIMWLSCGLGSMSLKNPIMH